MYAITVNNMKHANVPPSDSALTKPINVIINKKTILNNIFIPSILIFYYFICLISI